MTGVAPYVSNVGSQKMPDLKAKAAKTFGLLDFALAMLVKFKHTFESEAEWGYLHGSAVAAQKINTIIRDAPRAMSLELR